MGPLRCKIDVFLFDHSTLIGIYDIKYCQKLEQLKITKTYLQKQTIIPVDTKMPMKITAKIEFKSPTSSLFKNKHDILVARLESMESLEHVEFRMIFSSLVIV